MLQSKVQKIVLEKGLLSYTRRESLVKSVLSSMPIYFLTLFKMSKWAIARIDKFRRGF
jgi:hypothetical protein